MIDRLDSIRSRGMRHADVHSTEGRRHEPSPSVQRRPYTASGLVRSEGAHAEAFVVSDRVRVPLQNSSIESLDRFECTGEEGKCTVCMGEMEVGDEGVRLSCGHQFHGPCVEQWLRGYVSSCPVCRKECGPPGDPI